MKNLLIFVLSLIIISSISSLSQKNLKSIQGDTTPQATPSTTPTTTKSTRSTCTSTSDQTLLKDCPCSDNANENANCSIHDPADATKFVFQDFYINRNSATDDKYSRPLCCFAANASNSCKQEVNTCQPACCRATEKPSDCTSCSTVVFEKVSVSNTTPKVKSK